MKIEIHIHHHGGETIEASLLRIHQRLAHIEGKINIMAHTLDETRQQVAATKAGAESLIALFHGLKQQLSDILAGITLPPAIQAQVDAMFDDAKATADEITAEINAPGTQPAPTE